MASAHPGADKAGSHRVVTLPGARVRFVEAAGDDVWRGEDEAGGEVTVVVGDSGSASDGPRAQGREGAEVVAVYDGAPGTTLERLLSAESPLPPARALELARGLAEAVTRLHAGGGCHRDLRPARVLVGPPVRLVGAGVTGRGDPAYQAPEVALGELVGAPADVYAAAAIVYHLLAGRPPFEGKTAAEIISAQLVREPRPIAELVPDVSPALAAAIARSLAKREAERPKIDELAGALGAANKAPTRRFLGAPVLDPPILPAGPPSARATPAELDSTAPLPPVPEPRPPSQPPTPAPVPPRRRPVVAAVVGAAIVAGVVAWLALRPPRPPAPELPVSIAPVEAELVRRVESARRRGDLVTARSEAETFARAHPDDTVAFVLLGNVLFAQGEKDRALAAYREAVRMDRRLGADRELLANLRATFADPQRGEAAFKLAEEAGAPAEAILTDFAQATTSGPLKRRAAEAAGRIAARKGDAR